jgi:anaerobic selenocysteine-containing dehydrogenase
MSNGINGNGETGGVSRRGLLKEAALGAAAAAATATAGLGGCGGTATETRVVPTATAGGKAAAEFDFASGSGALRADRTVDAACQFCNSLCRLKVRVKDGRIIDVRGETDDPVQAGGLCVKGETLMTQLVYNRHRLRTPLKRVGGAKGDPASRFEAVSWDEALGIIAAKLLELRDAGEARAVANRTSGRLPRGTGSLAGRFFELLGSPNDTDVGPVCNDAGGDALAWTFGLGNFTNGYGVDPATGREDLGSAKFFLLLGTNQAETHPVTFAHLLRERAKTGAGMAVVDPRKTPTAEHADEWIAPKPHTDMALGLGMLGHILAEGLHDREFVRRWCVGFDELAAHVKAKGYTPEWTEGVTGVPAAVVRKLATRYAAAKPAAIFCNAGISHQLSAFQTYRVLAILAAVTGNVGVPGGGCNFMHNTWPGDLRLPPLQGKPPARGPALPVGPDRFAESILDGQPYRLRAIICEGNPLLSSAGSDRVREAFRKLEFFAYTGLFMEEAALYADVILPVCSGFEMEGVYMRRDDRGIRWQSQAVARVGESRPDWEIWLDLAAAMARLDRKNPPEYWTANLRPEWKDFGRLWTEFVRHTPGMGGMTRERMERRAEPLRWPCPSADHPGVSTLYLDHPSWYEAVESLNPAMAGRRFPTPSGKVELFTPEMERKLSAAGHSALPTFYTHPEVTGRHPVMALTDEFVRNPVNPGALIRKARPAGESDGTVHKDFPLMGMIGRPSVVHFAGVTQWTYTGKQMNGVRHVQIHPATAERLGVRAGDAVIVESPRGSAAATAVVWPGLREDTVFLDNTFGPAQRLAEELGAPLYEPANRLTDERHYDNLSGQQAYKCFACRVRKA